MAQQNANGLSYPFIWFPFGTVAFPENLTPQETSRGHILDEVVTTDYMLCKSLCQMKWQHLKKKKHTQDITFPIKFNLD